MKTRLLCLLSLAAAGLLPGFAQPPEPPADRPEFRELRERLRDMPPEQRREFLREMREQFRDLPPEQRQDRLRQLREQGPRPERAVPGRPPGREPGPQAAPRGGGMPTFGAGLERVRMALTPEQRESLRRNNAGQRERVQALEERLHNARQSALETSLARDFNEAALRDRLEAAARLEVELNLLRARAISRVDPPLSPRQIERIKNPPPAGAAAREHLRGRVGGPPRDDAPARPARPAQ